MLLKPTAREWQVVFHYCGRLIFAVGLFMLIPLVTGVIFGELNAVLDFAIGAAITIAIGLVLAAVFPETSDLSTVQGMVIVAMTWVFASLLAAVPLYLSGHYLSYLDAWFDGMSGLTTSGLAVIQDMDHASNAVNMWRHLMQFMGGMGIVVVALSLFLRVSGAGGAFEAYAGEAREERILPNVVKTAQIILVISIAYLVIGTTSMTGAFLYEGMTFVRALLHGIWVFMAAFSTGGFAPQSQSILYYHSGLVEMVTVPLMVAGALSFGLHHALWRRQPEELWRNIEPVSIFITTALLTAGVTLGLAVIGMYTGWGELFRKGVYQLISAQTTTGFQTVYPAELATAWGGFALLCMMVAMGLGASASSTGGGIKALRIGIAFKTFILEIRRLIYPDHAVITQKYHHFKDRALNERVVRNTLLVFTAFILTFFTGAALAMSFGYSFTDSLFESTSAAATVGLSAGVTSASMPAVLKVMYIVEMWTGRLEFLSIWALAGWMVAAWRGK